jgi:hypothetical protein
LLMRGGDDEAEQLRGEDRSDNDRELMLHDRTEARTINPTR